MITTLERLIRTHPIWFLPSVSGREEIAELLSGKEEGVSVFVFNTCAVLLTTNDYIKCLKMIGQCLLKEDFDTYRIISELHRPPVWQSGHPGPFYPALSHRGIRQPERGTLSHCPGIYGHFLNRNFLMLAMSHLCSYM